MNEWLKFCIYVSIILYLYSLVFTNTFQDEPFCTSDHPSALIYLLFKIISACSNFANVEFLYIF